MNTPESTVEAVIPELEYRGPDCPLCCDETVHDGDTFVCEDCGIYWPDPHGPGRRMEADSTPACGAEIQPWQEHPRIADQRFRCVLDAGHDKDKRPSKHAGVRVDKADGHGTHRWGEGR